MAAFEELLEEKPATKITVVDIVKRCGITRNTFYYHFQDIPALTQELAEDKVDRLIATQYVPGSPMDCVRPIIEYVLAHKKAIMHIYRYIPRESFQQQVTTASQYLVDAYFAKIKEEYPDAPQEHIRILSHFFRCTMVGMLLDWLEEGLPESFLNTAEEICDLLEGTTKRLLETHSDS